PIGSFTRTDGSAPPPSVPSVPQSPPSFSAPPTVTTLGPMASPSPPASAAAPTAPAPPPVKPDATTELLRDVNYVVTSAKEIRGMSDMQGALELLRRADELTPDHPAIIAEMAQTYEQMGITAKAMDNWRRIQLLGETKAGSYFELAARRLGSGSAAVTAPPAMPGGDSEKFLRLGACQVKRDFSVNAGERYVVRVPIARAGNHPVNGQEMNLEVFFFDRVNGTKVAQTIAPEPVETWQSAPVDWSGTGEETLDVVYHLPALSAAEIQQHGRRSYYGYMLRLYYNNKLQDVAAEPRDLLEFGSAPGTAPAGVNPLLPPMSR
ncbi:tetratricopeptide repeat protein, partial [Prosthecobacter sp.]|uniref:tetratricopeptide repeat protein n=1 Tax=Prosthecobacter sp. TaxID=1965333 RepID=UPI001E0C2319